MRLYSQATIRSGCVILAFLSQILVAQGLNYATFAGPGDPGDGQSAVFGFVPAPSGVVVRRDGAVFIAELKTARIRMVSPDGIIMTFAGTGSPGFNGDGGPASQAQIDTPRGLALDADGSLYFADSGSNRIRKISSDGSVTTIAGTGQPGFSGDETLAVNAQLDHPYDVKVASDGVIFIADYGNNRVRSITRDGIIHTIAGNGDWGDSSAASPALQSPLENVKTLALSPEGEVYLSDWSYRIRKISASGTLSAVAGTGFFGFSGDGGPATAAQIGGVEGIATDSAGTLYISDSWTGRIRSVTPDGVIQTVAGEGLFSYFGDGLPALDALRAYPTFLAADLNGRVVFSDFGNSRVRRFFPGSSISTIAGSDDPLDGGTAVNGRLLYPTGVAVDSNGVVYISDQGHQRVRRVTPDGIIQTVAGTGVAGSAEGGNSAVAAQLFNPAGLAVDAASGSLYLADLLNGAIRRIDPNGHIETVVSGLHGPAAIAVASDGALYFPSGNLIEKISPAGRFSIIAGDGSTGYSGDGGSSLAAELSGPQGIALDSRGVVYVADTGNSCIRTITPDGIIHTLAGNGYSGFSGDEGPAAQGQLSYPVGLTIDSGGNLYIADSGNDRIRMIDVDGTVHTLVGPEAGLSWPQAVSIDSFGSVFVADTQNLRVMKFVAASSVTARAQTPKP